jgi:hypothetical protein
MNSVNPYASPTAQLNPTLDKPQQDITTSEKLNPWFSIWTKPRATMQHIISTNPTRFVLLLAAVSGFGEALSQASMNATGDQFAWPTIVAMAAILGPIGGLIGLYVIGFLMHWTGRWIGGQASTQHIRSAVAWSSVPMIWALLIWIPKLMLFGQELFTSSGANIESNPFILSTVVGFGILETVISVWAFVVCLHCLGQVQGFSAWRALVNSILAGLIVVGPILMLAIAITNLP